MNTKQLAKEVAYLMDWPIDKYFHKSKSHKVVRAVLKAIVDALQRGEQVWIQGFGTFRVVEYPPKVQRMVYFYGSNRKNAYVEKKLVGPYKVVRFHPSDGLREFVDKDYKNA